MADPVDLAARVIQLETLLMHQQRDLDALGDVAREQQRQLDALRRQLAGLEDRLTDEGETPEPRDPQAERPPHY